MAGENSEAPGDDKNRKGKISKGLPRTRIRGFSPQPFSGGKGREIGLQEEPYG